MASTNNADSERHESYYDDGAFVYGPDANTHDAPNSLLSHNWAYHPNQFYEPEPSNDMHQAWHGIHDMHDSHANIAVDPPRATDPFTSYSNTTPAFGGTSFTSAQAFTTTYPELTPYTNSLTPQDLYSTNPYAGQDLASTRERPHERTITPAVLQSQSDSQARPSVVISRNQSAEKVSKPPSLQPFANLPRGSASGYFLITSLDDLNRATKTRKLCDFLNVGDVPADVLITKSTIPAYNPRLSRNSIKRLLATDNRLSAQLSKKSSKKGENALAKYQSGQLSAKSNTQPRAPKTSQSPSSPSSSEEDSDGSEESEDELPQPPLPPSRPTTALGAIEYDTIKILWRAPSLGMTADDIRTSLTSFWDIIKTIRDRWVSDSAAVKQAEDAKKVHEIPLLQERVASQRTMLEMALKTAVEMGSSDIVEHCGELIPLMGCLTKFLFDRTKESDYSGPFCRTLLTFLSKCKTMTDGALEKTQLAKVLPRFGKRGDEGIKTLVKRITDNAIAASKKKKGSLKTNAAAQDDSVAGGAVRKPAQPIAGVKRPLNNDASSTGDQAAKRIANSNAVSTSSGVSAKLGPTSKQPMTSTTTGKAGTTAAAPIKKIQQAAPSTTNFFSSLASAAKKPGTSNAAIAAAAQTKNIGADAANDKKAALQDKKVPVIKREVGGVEKKVSASIAPSVAPKSGFSFSSMMANLGKPKEEEPATPKAEEVKVVETEEERKKRLHKEARRKLRVSWKPDSALEEVRLFTHDPDEDLGHDASQTRDVDDIKNEGRMFKSLQNQGIDDNEEDEEADCSVKEESIKPHHTVKTTDFSMMDEDSKSGNFAPFGGGTQRPVSLERETQERREANTLLAVYSRLADIPASPREPIPEETPQAPSEMKSFGAPEEVIFKRLEAIRQQQSRGAEPASAATSALSAALSALGERPTQVQQPSPQSVAGLEAIFARFAAPTQNPTPTPAPVLPFANVQPQAPPPVSFPAMPPAQASTPDVSAILAALQQANASAPMQQQPPPLPLAPPVATAPPPPIPAPNMDFSQFAPPPFMQMPPAFMQQMFQQMQQQGMPQAHQAHSEGVYENEERKRWREQGGVDDDDDGNASKRRKQQWNKPKDPNRPTPKFVVQCKYWKEGKCRKGANCTFLHT